MAEAQENAIKQAKIKWSNCKGALTCQGKVVCHRLSANRPAEEIRKELKKYELAFEDLLLFSKTMNNSSTKKHGWKNVRRFT